MTLTLQDSGLEQLQLVVTRCQPIPTLTRDPLPPPNKRGANRGKTENPRLGAVVKEKKGVVGGGAGLGKRCFKREGKLEALGAGDPGTKRFGCLLCLP